MSLNASKARSDEDGRTATTAIAATTITRPRLHGEHGHSHGLVDRSIVRSREGVKAVSISLVVLGVAAVVQTAIFVLSGSVALLADLIHNFGDALTAVPLGIAFFLRSFRGEKIAGLAVVLAIFVSRLRRALRDDPALHPPAAPHASLGARRAGRRRVRRQRDRRAGAAARREAAGQPGARSPTATTPASTASSRSA